MFFFFQAEDGIRDTSVTGVQTCALPISPVRVHRGELIEALARLGPGNDRFRALERVAPLAGEIPVSDGGAALDEAHLPAVPEVLGELERRLGGSCPLEIALQDMQSAQVVAARQDDG